ncbi:MAG: hypothetical protein C3F08_07445 [Candidatus Methylomirabilota bacterium]|nr:MAG: hypothetical protein C3F08_07445 [candidate division NC10 bacterium]
MNRFRDQEALLSMLRASLHEEPFPAAPICSSLDWHLLQRLVHHHRVGPLLSYGLYRARFGGIPNGIRSKWEAQRREAIATGLYHLQALEELATRFDAQAIPFILLKGEALSKTCYPDEGLRPYNDIDLLIKEDSYEAARTVLTAAGFQPRYPHLESEKRKLFGEFEFDRQGPRLLTVDLHWDTLMVSWKPPSLLGETLAWDCPDRIYVGTQIIRVLGGEILLLFLCVHLAFHHVFDGLILLCDLFLALKRDGDRIDWDRFLQMAHRYQCRQAAYYALTSVQSLLGAHVPTLVLNQLRPPAKVRLLMPTERLLVRDRAVPQILERYIKFLLIDYETDRMRAAWSWWQSSKPWMMTRGGRRHHAGAGPS